MSLIVNGFCFLSKEFLLFNHSHITTTLVIKYNISFRRNFQSLTFFSTKNGLTTHNSSLEMTTILISLLWFFSSVELFPKVKTIFNFLIWYNYIWSRLNLGLTKVILLLGWCATYDWNYRQCFNKIVVFWKLNLPSVLKK